MLVQVQVQVKYCFRNIRETEDERPLFIDDNILKKYSSTYKILHGNLQQIFSDDSSSDVDVGSQKEVINKDSGSPQQQLKATNDAQICRKPNVVSSCICEVMEKLGLP
jgi:hypothetical protein